MAFACCGSCNAIERVSARRVVNFLPNENMLYVKVSEFKRFGSIYKYKCISLLPLYHFRPSNSVEEVDVSEEVKRRQELDKALLV